MLILADENMPFAREIFAQLGEVRTVAGRTMSAADAREADLLMVRSVTRVGPELLEGSRVKFVGTATIGTDHVDLAYLKSRGIGFASAPGCNAESVAQYVGAALAFAAGRQGRRLSQGRLGIIGVGNCGRRVERVARGLGMEVALNDPPLARETGDEKYRPLEELLECDYLTLHVPLTREGADATWRLIDEKFLERVKPGTVLINASRGFVIDEAALARQMAQGGLGGVVLDAWENEPGIDEALARGVTLGTPHIAGYSHDGKVMGTCMIYEVACKHLGIAPRPVELAMPAAGVERIRVSGAGRTFDSVAAELMLTAYPIQRDAADLLTSLREAPTPEARAAAFDERRKRYPLRREFAATWVELEDAPPEWRARIEQIGFDIA